MMGCLVSRPEIKGKNCADGGILCFQNLVQTCSSGYLENNFREGKMRLQVVGLVEDKCHVYGEGNPENVLLNMDCFLSSDEFGNYEFSGSTLECKGSLADAIRGMTVYQQQTNP